MKKLLKWIFGEEFDKAIEKKRLQEREFARKQYERQNIANLESITNLLAEASLLHEQKTELQEKLEKANEEIEELKIYRLQYLELLQRTVK